MKYATDNELETRKNSQGPGFEWRIHEVSCRVMGNGRIIWYPDIVTKYVGFRCLRCQDNYLYDDCINCGGPNFEIANGGIYCSRCLHGFDVWHCDHCNTSNPVANSLLVLEKPSSCFIATAAYGSHLAPEVDILRYFRDTRLRTTYFGRSIILIYEMHSPRLAKVIAKHPALRLVMQRFILSLIVETVRNRIGKDYLADKFS